MNKPGFVLLIALICISSVSLEAKKIDLKYSFQAGMVLHFNYTVTQEVGQEVMGQSQSTNTVTQQRMSYEVLEITPEGNYKMSRTISDMNIKMTSPMGDIEFNSDDIPEADGPWKIMEWFTQEALTFVMSPKGEVLSVEHADELMDKAAGMVENVGPESQILVNLAAQFSSKEGILESIAPVFLGYPAGKVKKGKPWEVVSELNQMITFRNTVLNTITDVNSEQITISQQVKIEQADAQEATEMQGMEMSYELSGGKEGVYFVEPASGLTSKYEGVISISGIISVDSPQLPSPMTIPMTIKSTELIELLEGSD